jgi:hypothetical protein
VKTEIQTARIETRALYPIGQLKLIPWTETGSMFSNSLIYLNKSNNIFYIILKMSTSNSYLKYGGKEDYLKVEGLGLRKGKEMRGGEREVRRENRGKGRHYQSIIHICWECHSKTH